jgi:hypothetical protein
LKLLLEGLPNEHYDEFINGKETTKIAGTIIKFYGIEVEYHDKHVLPDILILLLQKYMEADIDGTLV